MTQCLLTKSERRQIHLFTKIKKEGISKATITSSVLTLLTQQNVDSLVKRHRHYAWILPEKIFLVIRHWLSLIRMGIMAPVTFIPILSLTVSGNMQLIGRITWTSPMSMKLDLSTGPQQDF